MRAADDSGPAVFDRDVLSLDIAGFAQSLVKRGYHGFGLPDALEGLSQPITGIAFCCAWRIRAVVMAAPTVAALAARHSTTSSAKRSTARPVGHLTQLLPEVRVLRPTAPWEQYSLRGTVSQPPFPRGRPLGCRAAGGGVRGRDGRVHVVVRVPRRVFRRLLPERPRPERCVEAHYLQRTRFESIANGSSVGAG